MKRQHSEWCTCMGMCLCVCVQVYMCAGVWGLCTYPGWGGLQAWPCTRGVGGTENRPSVLYSSLIKRTHHRQPLLKYPKWGLLHRQQVCTKDAGFPGAVLRVDQMPQVRGGRERTQPDTAPLPSRTWPPSGHPAQAVTQEDPTPFSPPVWASSTSVPPR